MDERALLETVRSVREEWDALDVPRVVCDVLEVAEKRCALSETGELVEAVEERKECASELLGRIRVLGDVGALLESLVENVRNIPSFEDRVKALKQEVCDEKQRNSTVDQLMDSLERLKKECKAQVALAESAAESQASVDFSLCMNSFWKQREDAQQEVSKVEQEVATVSQQRDEVLRVLKNKESEYDMTNTIRRDQIDSLRTELAETERLLSNMEKERDDIEKSGALQRVETCVDEKRTQLNDLDAELARMQARVSAKNNEHRATANVEYLRARVLQLEAAIEQLPSPLEWDKAQKLLESARATSQLHHEQKSLDQAVASLKDQQLAQIRSLDSLTDNLKSLKSKRENLRQSIASIVDQAANTSDLARVLKSQFSALESQIARAEAEIRNLRESNVIKRQEKETWERDIEQLKRNLKSYDPENPVIYHQTPKTNRQLFTNPVLQFLLSNQHTRAATVIYVIVVHILIYIISSAKFMP